MSKITESAKNETCSIRIPGVCNHNPETTVFCHMDKLRFGKGIGYKSRVKGFDLGAYGCSACHQAIHDNMKDSYEAHLEGTLETIMRLVEKGLVNHA